MEVGFLEYRVRPVTRYVVTRFAGSSDKVGPAPSVKGEYPNAEVAFEVAMALCRDEHLRLGFPIDSPQVQYPRALVDAEVAR